MAGDDDNEHYVYAIPPIPSFQCQPSDALSRLMTFVMSIGPNLENDARANDPVAIESDQIRAIVKSGRTATIQFSKPGYTRELLRAVNRLCVELEDKLEIRFYGHYQGHFDASVLEELPDAHWISVDCLPAISNEQQIGKLPKLNRLSFGVYQFNNPRFLETVNVAQLKELTLGRTAKRNFDLASLKDSRRLETALIEGHTNNIEILSSLPKLGKLTLTAFPKHKSLQFLSDANDLRSLRLILGGRSSFEEFHHSALEELSVVYVRGLETIGSLHRFPCLQSLHVENQLQIQSIDLAGASLRKVLLMNCKSLAKIDGLEHLDELFELRVSRTKLDLDALAQRDWPPALSVLALYSGSRKWNDATRVILDRRGYREWDI